MRGPVPKRENQRRRQNKTHIERAAAGSSTPVEPPALRPGIHPLAQRWYESLALSGQSVFYEPSDWMMAQVIAEAIEAYAIDRKGSTLAGIMAGASNLLVTEGDRRRLRLELDRGETVDHDEQRAVASVADIRAKLSG